MGRRFVPLSALALLIWCDVAEICSEERPKAQLSRDEADVPAGGNVTLTGSVFGPSSGWRYSWFRGPKPYEPMTAHNVGFLSNEEISVSEGGIYRCKGGRGNPVYYTADSDPVVTSRAVVTLQTNWTQIYEGETITLTCDLEGGEDTEWEYEWRQREHGWRPAEYERRLWHSSGFITGNMLRDVPSSYRYGFWSRPRPVLDVSPRWQSSGGSVTLTCRISDPSAGWRFYWFKLLADPFRFDSEPLPGSINGLFYGPYSDPGFAWSGDAASGASLTVSPDRSQHFINESVSLSCHGNDTQWEVIRYPKSGYRSPCSRWGVMNGSVCNPHRPENMDGVYWCVSDTGLLSNAINISRQSSDIIMTSPVHPVAEGHSVTLGCKLKTENVPTSVHFYKDGKLIQEDLGEMLTIAEVSMSDEGFYKCEGKDPRDASQSWTSPESWVSVKSMPAAQSSPVCVGLIVLRVSGISVILLIWLWYFYKKSQASRLIRSQSTNQGSAADDPTSHYDTVM